MIIYVGPSCLLAERYLMGPQTLWDKDCVLDLQIQEMVSRVLAMGSASHHRARCGVAQHTQSPVHLGLW